MNFKVRAKQNISRECFVCGDDNGAGLKAQFYVLENNWLVAVFRPQHIHQSYPARLHGGIAATILDEAIGRAVNCGALTPEDADVWGVTVDFSVRFKKPIPLNQELRVVCTIDKKNRRFFEGRGVLLLGDNSIAVTAHGKYMAMALDKIAEMDAEGDDWKPVLLESDPLEFELPINLFEK